jgi:hypothetical protein
MIAKVYNYVKSSLKKNFKIGQYFERLQTLLMGAVTLFAFAVGGWQIGSVMLLVSLIDPCWFDD